MSESRFTPLLTSLAIQFKNTVLLEEAFTHRSFLNEAGREVPSNERLEFLGDAILSFVISHFLFKEYPHHPEGILTNLRSSIVKTETLSLMSTKLTFGQYLLLSKGEEKGGGRTNPSLLADTFEAFLGALFLDQGLPAVENFLQAHFLPEIPDIIAHELHSDYKSKLQETVQEFSNTPPTYNVTKTEGPDHAKKFWVQVGVDGGPTEVGEGKSKQEAEQLAAAHTLEKMGKV